MVRIGDAYAEVVVHPSRLVSVYVWSKTADDASASTRIGYNTLQVVTAWTADTRVIRSTIWDLQLVDDEIVDQLHTRQYVGELPSKFHKGGEILFIAPIVWIDDSRQLFDLIIEIPASLDQLEEHERDAEVTPETGEMSN
ncbi:MAG: hypothetical protein ACPGXK_09185 [Phycisphaerae bacterium]